MVVGKTVAVLLVAVSCATVARADPGEEADAARARDLAAVLGLAPLLERIVHAKPPASPEESLARVSAVEQAIVALSRAGLTLDAMLARLQREEFAAENAYDVLEDRHEDSLTRWNIAAILVGNGVSIAGTAMQFGNIDVANAGNGLVITGSTVAAAFSIFALVKHEAGPLPLSIDTNLLAPLLDRPATARSRYPDCIWRYLDTKLAGSSTSIRRELIDRWTREGKLPPKGAPEAERRLTLLSAPLRAPGRVDADALDDRASMLADVRERLASLSVDLDLVWHQVHAQR
jgi:hypothetical protein